tara:strand:+ start:318 stop:788 length:471 start_codon:yes stop_codon:yes gene_type:complete
MSSYIFQLYARQIKKETGINCFSSKRTDAHAMARSILNKAYMQTQIKVKLKTISDFYKHNNKHVDHATIIHSIKSFDIYFKLPQKKQEKELGKSVKDIYYKLLLLQKGNQLNTLKVTQIPLLQKLAFLTTEQSDQLNIIINTYVAGNIKKYVEKNA